MGCPYFPIYSKCYLNIEAQITKITLAGIDSILAAADAVRTPRRGPRPFGRLYGKRRRHLCAGLPASDGEDHHRHARRVGAVDGQARLRRVVAAGARRIPTSAWVLLVVIAPGSNILIGIGASKLTSEPTLMLVLPLVIAVAFALIADIDSPRGGMFGSCPRTCTR